MWKFPWKVFNENLNVLLIPESGAKIASFRLRRQTVHSALSAASVAAILLVVSVFVFIESEERADLLVAITGENLALTERLGEIDDTIGMLRASVEHNAACERRALSLAGLQDPILEEASMGFGGPESVPGMEQTALNPELQAIVGRAEMELDHLLRTSESQRQGYELTLDALRERNEKFDHTPSIHPLRGEGWYSSGYGTRPDPFTGRPAFHAALDISCRLGSPIVSTADGVVKRSGKDGFYGLAVRIDHGTGIETVYAHNAENLVKRGDSVRRGQVIAKVGSSGRSTGPHLHYAVIVDGKHVNPKNFILPEDVVVD